MKIELTEEIKFGEDESWKSVRIDGEYVIGSYSMEKAQKMYENIKRELLEHKELKSTNILKSEEI